MHKVFETQRRASSGERVTFEIPAGSGQIYEAIPDAPGGVFLDTAKLQSGGFSSIAAIGDFFETVLLPESRDRFEKALRSPDPTVMIGLDDAAEILRWLMSEVYIGRPTAPASSSPAEAVNPSSISTQSASVQAATP